MADAHPNRPCAINDCPHPARSRGWCIKHYTRWRQHGDPLKTVRPASTAVCTAPGCNKPSLGKQYCCMHRTRLSRCGSIDLPPRSEGYLHNGYRVVRRKGHPLASRGQWVREHRLVLFEQIGPGVHDCHWCGMKVSWDRSYPKHADGLVVDHLDGSPTNNDPANLVPSCAVCNLQRGHGRKRAKRPPVESPDS